VNYIDEKLNVTKQNKETNLDDANGRAIWALGFLISKKSILPSNLISQANSIMKFALPQLEEIHSTRAVAFIIKGLFYYHEAFGSNETIRIIDKVGQAHGSDVQT
jgi:hypothetical protein